MSLDARSPLVDDGGVTFVWWGDGPPPTVVGDWCDWDAERGLEMVRRAGRWTAALPLPRDAYLEYRFLVRGELVPDPLNPQRTRNGVGGVNSRAWMPDAARRAIALRRRRGPRGSLRRETLSLGWGMAGPNPRRLDLYLPAGVADPRSLPLLLVLDGPDYLDRGRLNRTLDALIDEGAVAPMAAAFLANAGPARAVEYAASDMTLHALAEVVVPAVIERLDLATAARADGRGPVAILGSSLGGVMALHAALRRPDVFGTAIVQSCAVGRGRDWTTVVLARVTPPGPARLWLDVGMLEGLAAPVDDLAGLLTARGHDVRYQPFPAGHNQTGWAESLVDALPAMFPGPGGRSGPGQPATTR